MMRIMRAVIGLYVLAGLVSISAAQNTAKKSRVFNIKPLPIKGDKSVNYDFDIVYVRGKRRSDGKEARWAEFSRPTMMQPGADLMLLHPDGSEELLVSGEDGSVMDPYVSFDGEWVFYAKFIDSKHTGADIWKIHVPTRKQLKLTNQKFTPNTGAAPWSKGYRTPRKGKSALPYGVYNLGPCPVPGGKVMFTSNRNAHVPPRGYPRYTLQLFLMDDDGSNVEQVGYINIACALHPVILRDGRILYSTLESHGAHNSILWGIWSIHPDGTNWAPVISAFENGGAPSGYHFQSQLSDGSIIIEKYYNQNQKGFGTLFKLPESHPPGQPAFGPGNRNDARNQVKYVDYNGRERAHAVPFSPAGMELITPWIFWQDQPSYPSVTDDPKSPRIGKVTHPCGAPDNHLLVAWTMGPIGGSAGAVRDYMVPRLIDSGIYLIKEGRTTTEPGAMLLVKNDPNYNEQWPRPLVPYERIYGVKEPKQLIHNNDGTTHKSLPEGSPFGLVGTSSLYKRESAPAGVVPTGSVTAVVPDKIPKRSFNNRWKTNWSLQGSDAGLYENDEIHAIRIVAQEPRTDIAGRGRGGSPLYASHALERLRILGEIPVRKFNQRGQEPTDPDGNPDTSFLAKLPADQSFTFQLIDKNGMTLTSAQTWHQLRPGERRWDCGGCHAHSQTPTAFESTAAAQTDYKLFDLTHRTPLLTDKARDKSDRRWDRQNSTGLRYVESGVVNVEYFRDIKPILERSCVACHTHKSASPPADLVLDDDRMGSTPAFGHDAGPAVHVPNAYFRIAAWKRYTRPRAGEKVTPHAASRYVTKFQSRRSLLVWKIYGRRFDGYHNDDYPTITKVGDLTSLRWKGKPVPDIDYSNSKALSEYIRRYVIDNDFTGSEMPPQAAVESGKVQPLSDEDRRTIVRWIDLGCPIDIDPRYMASSKASKSYGWMGDDQRPTLTLTLPSPGTNQTLSRILIGMTDAYTGIDASSLSVRANFQVNDIPAGHNLANHFETLHGSRLQLKLNRPITALKHGTLTVTVSDHQGNVSRIKREFTVGND